MNYSRWSSDNEVKNILKEVSTNCSIKSSGIPMGYSDDKLLIKDDNSHSLIISSPGSGKTQAVMLPQVRLAIKANESFFVSDIKGEIFKEVGGELKKNNYNIIVLDYANLEKGNHYNILSFPYYLYNNGNKDKAILLLEDIGYYLIHDDDDTSDSFWEKSARDYFVGLTLYLFETIKEEEINLNSVFNLSNKIFKGEDDLDKIIMEKINNNSSAYQFLSSTLFAPKETSGGIIATFSQKVKKFVSREKLSNMMATSDFDIKNIGNDKNAIFVISGTSNCSNDLAEILLNQIFYSIDIYGNKSTRFNFIIDEFDSFKSIKDFYIKTNYARGINIRITAFIKNFTNLNNVYGNKNKNLIRLCFDNIIYLYTNDLYTLEEISKLCGNTSKGPLISVEELKVINNFEEIILIPRMYPIRTKVKPDYDINWNMD
ncbi:MAG: type IV secretory system conjugative DNA transfer family protein [Bacilli bacterium]